MGALSSLEKRLFAGLVILALVIVSRGSHAMNGGAPHYLAATDSLVRDFDLDLANQYAPDSPYVFHRVPASAWVRPGRDGGLYPVSGVGFSAALIPVFLIADGIAARLPESMLTRLRWNRERCARDLISFAMALLYGWTAVLTLRITSRLLRRDDRWLPVAVAFVSPPMLFMSILALPALPAAFLCAWFVWEQSRTRPRALRTVVPLALLPWLDLDYIVIALAGLLWIWRLASTRANRTTRATALTVVAASVTAVVALRVWMLGFASPVEWSGGVGTLMSAIAGLGSALFDLDEGLLWLAPIWLVALAGIPGLSHVHPHSSRFALVGSLGLWVLAGFDTSASAAPPGGWLVPMVPVLAAFLAEGVDVVTGSWTRWFAAAALLWTVSLAILVVGRPGRIWATELGGLVRAPATAVRWVGALNSPQAKLRRLGLTPDSDSFVAAVRRGDVRAVQLFLGTDLPRLDAGRGLAWASVEGRSDLVRLLAGAGASIEARDDAGETPLIASVRTGRADERELLIGLGANLDATTNVGRTALAFAVFTDDAEALGQLIAAGADVNLPDADGWTPFMSAVRAGRGAAARTLIVAGADVNVMSSLGWTALMWAANAGDVDLVRALLERGADPDTASKAGLTALIRAAGQGHLEVVQALLQAGADATTRVDGADALTWAARNGHDGVVRVLKPMGGP